VPPFRTNCDTSRAKAVPRSLPYCILTRDEDLLRLREYQGIGIMMPDAFLPSG
jgi:predicted nucleic acid-binding protein